MPCEKAVRAVKSLIKIYMKDVAKALHFYKIVSITKKILKENNGVEVKGEIM